VLLKEKEKKLADHSPLFEDNLFATSLVNHTNTLEKEEKKSPEPQPHPQRLSVYLLLAATSSPALFRFSISQRRPSCSQNQDVAFEERREREISK